MNSDPRPFVFGQRVYCPTYGYYGILMYSGAETASISLLNAPGLGMVDVRHGHYEHPKYALETGYSREIYDRYERYTQAVWARDPFALALPFQAWLLAGHERYREALEKIAANATEDYRNTAAQALLELAKGE